MSPRGGAHPAVDPLEQRRQDIIVVAFDVFANRGYTAVGIEDITGRLGLARGTFYRYFTNKRDVLDAVIDDLVDRLAEAIESEAQRSSQPPPVDVVDELGRIFYRLFALLESDPRIGRILMCQATSVDDAMTSRMLALSDTFALALSDRVAAAADRGVVCEELDPRLLGHAIASLALPGLLQLTRASPGTKTSEAYLTAYTALLRDGLRAR